MNIKISVVIPAYNEELFLPRLLKSLKKQTFKEKFEVIVVDNNSTDKTVSVAKSFNAKVVVEKNQGYAQSCNRGFFAAKGEIIARADADYVVPEGWLQEIYDTFKKDSSLIGIGGPTYPLESTWLENVFYYPFVLIWMYILKVFRRGYLFPNMAVKKEAFYKTGGWNTKIAFGEDQNMCVQLKEIGEVGIVPNMYVYTSVRKLRFLGLFKHLFGYSFANQINMAFGIQKFVGMESVRVVPLQAPRPDKPGFYLFFMPIVVSMLVLLGTIFLSVKPVQADVIKEGSKLAIVHIQTKITNFKKQFSNIQNAH